MVDAALPLHQPARAVGARIGITALCSVCGLPYGHVYGQVSYVWVKLVVFLPLRGLAVIRTVTFCRERPRRSTSTDVEVILRVFRLWPLVLSRSALVIRVPRPEPSLLLRCTVRRRWLIQPGTTLAVAGGAGIGKMVATGVAARVTIGTTCVSTLVDRGVAWGAPVGGDPARGGESVVSVVIPG